MEISIPRSSCAVPSTIPQRRKASSCNYDNRFKPIKPTTAKNNVKSTNVFPSKRPTNKSNLVPARLGKSRFSKSLLYCQLHERNSIEVWFARFWTCLIWTEKFEPICNFICWRLSFTIGNNTNHVKKIVFIVMWKLWYVSMFSVLVVKLTSHKYYSCNFLHCLFYLFQLLAFLFNLW